MNRSLKSRMAVLEERHRRIARAEDPRSAGDCEGAIEAIQQWLRELGIEQGSSESLSATVCRASGITAEELKMLQEAAFRAPEEENSYR